jgi:predicted HTH domain antitoxin
LYIPIKNPDDPYLYKRGLVSFGRAAELAGLSQKELMRQARANGIEPRWSEKMVEDELV